MRWLFRHRGKGALNKLRAIFSLGVAFSDKADYGGAQKRDFLLERSIFHAKQYSKLYFSVYTNKIMTTILSK